MHSIKCETQVCCCPRKRTAVRRRNSSVIFQRIGLDRPVRRSPLFVAREGAAFVAAAQSPTSSGSTRAALRVIASDHPRWQSQRRSGHISVASARLRESSFDKGRPPSHRILHGQTAERSWRRRARDFRVRKMSAVSDAPPPSSSPAAVVSPGHKGCCARKKAPEEMRSVQLNGPHPHYPNNYISTAKYNALTFLPRALFEQCVVMLSLMH